MDDHKINPVVTIITATVLDVIPLLEEINTSSAPRSGKCMLLDSS